MKKTKLNVKSFVAGMLLMALLTPLAATASEVATRQITYGVNVVVNGQRLQLEGIDRPFIMDGRTFLPVRAVSDALDVTVDWDGGTSTVYLGDRFAGQRVPLRQAAPFFDRSPNSDRAVDFLDFAIMGGITYNNALRFGAWNDGVLGVSGLTHFSLHNLNGQYRVFGGYFGRIDGSGMQNATVHFIGDGRTLQTLSLNAADMPAHFDIFVEGVQQLRVEVVFSNFNNAPQYALVGYLE